MFEARVSVNPKAQTCYRSCWGGSGNRFTNWNRAQRSTHAHTIPRQIDGTAPMRPHSSLEEDYWKAVKSKARAVAIVVPLALTLDAFRTGLVLRQSFNRAGTINSGVGPRAGCPGGRARDARHPRGHPCKINPRVLPI